MTLEESEEFEKLDETQKQEFMDGVQLRREHLMLKTAVASLFLVECLDEVETLGLLRHQLKQAGKKFHAELEKYVTEIFAVNESNSESTDYLNVQIKAFHEIFDRYEPIEPKK